MQLVEPPHDGEVSFRHRARQVVDTVSADVQHLGLPGDRQIMLTVDHRPRAVARSVSYSHQAM
jgi:hypothetical protein